MSAALASSVRDESVRVALDIGIGDWSNSFVTENGSSFTLDK